MGLSFLDQRLTAACSILVGLTAAVDGDPCLSLDDPKEILGHTSATSVVLLCY